MTAQSANPDDASVQGSAVFNWRSGGGGDTFGPYDREADELVNQGIETPDDEEAMRLYCEAYERYAEIDALVPLGDVRTWAVAREGITGFAAQASGPWLLNIPALSPEG